MADAKSPDEQIAALQQRLDVEFPELSQSIRTEMDGLQKVRASFVFRALVEGEADAQAKLAEVDRLTAEAQARLDAVRGEWARVENEVNEPQRDEADRLAGISREEAGKLGIEVETLAFEFKALVFEAAQKLLKLKSLSADAQKQLIHHGLVEEAAAYSYHGYRTALSAWVVLALGRQGKLNLNGTISSAASKEWAERTQQ